MNEPFRGVQGGLPPGRGLGLGPRKHSPTVFSGIAASGGTAVGRAYRTDRMRTVLTSRRTGSAATQINGAFDAVAARLRELAYSLRGEGQREQADIMDVACTIAEDPDLRGTAIRYAGDGDPVTVEGSASICLRIASGRGVVVIRRRGRSRLASRMPN